MKFRCELTYEEEDALRQARTKWHPWFAWYPVSISRGHCRWLETVERRNLGYWSTDWIYRDLTKPQ